MRQTDHSEQPTAEAISLREIGPEHARRMLAILQGAPMVARDMTICFDRRPSLFRMTELLYERFHYCGFFFQEELVGFMLFGLKHCYVGGRVEPVFTQTDTYFHPRIRGRGLAKRLWFRSFEFLLDRGVPVSTIGYNVIMKGNRPAESSIELKNPEPPFLPYSKKIADFEIHTLLTTFRRRESSRYDIRRATAGDVAAILRLLDEEHRGRLFGPIFTLESFDQMLAKRPDFGLENFLTAWSGSEMVGVCSVWDPSAFRQSRVVRYGPRFRLVVAGYGAAGRLFGFPALPKHGEAFRELDIAEYAVRDRDPEILKALLTRACNDARESRYHTVVFGSTGEDPLLQATRPFPRQAVGSAITLLGLTLERVEETRVVAERPYLNVALL